MLGRAALQAAVAAGSQAWHFCSHRWFTLFHFVLWLLQTSILMRSRRTACWVESLLLPSTSLVGAATCLAGPTRPPPSRPAAKQQCRATPGGAVINNCACAGCSRLEHFQPPSPCQLHSLHRRLRSAPCSAGAPAALLFGWLSDRVNRKRLLFAAVLLGRPHAQLPQPGSDTGSGAEAGEPRPFQHLGSL